MAWVRKRRAEREKAKLTAEKPDQESGDADAEQPQPTIPEEEEAKTPQLPKEDDIPRPPVDVPTASPAQQPHGQPEHITTAVTLPPHRLHKREQSFGHRIPVSQVESPSKEKPSFGVDVFDVDLGERPKVAAEPSTGSTSEEEGVEDEDTSTDEDDEDDSDGYFEEENSHSKTALGAGVEKVSRHKDTPQPKTPNLPHSPLKSQLPTTAIEA